MKLSKADSPWKISMLWIVNRHVRAQSIKQEPMDEYMNLPANIVRANLGFVGRFEENLPSKLEKPCAIN